MKRRGGALFLALALGTSLAACDSTKPLVFTNHDPVILSKLQAFPTAIGHVLFGGR